MPKTIHMAAVLAATPEEIYDMYLDPHEHEVITGCKAIISPRTGTLFKVCDGILTGQNLHLVRGRLIVQSWRAATWSREDIDSILVLTLTPFGEGQTQVDLMHVNVTDRDFGECSQGWEQYYFAPWREYLKRRAGKAAA